MCIDNSTETLEDLEYMGLRLIQKKSGFRFGTDAVLLSGFVRAKREEHIADLGSGSGILTVLVGARTGARISAVEIDPEAAALAKRNILLNGLEKAEVLNIDMRLAPKAIGRVNAVMINPPYFSAASGEPSASPDKKTARHELEITLFEIMRSAGALLGTGGRLYMIHIASRLPDVFEALRAAKLEPKEMRLISPIEGKDPSHVLIYAKKDAKSGLIVKSVLNILDKDGNETPEIRRIYHKEI